MLQTRSVTALGSEISYVVGIQIQAAASLRKKPSHGSQAQEAVLAWVLPVELDFLIIESLRLLGDIGGLSVCAVNSTEQNIRNHALARIRSFVDSGIVTERHVNILSRLMLREDIYPDDEDSLRIAELDFDAENFVDG